MGNNSMNELEEFGRKVSDIVDSAVNSSDFRQLNETISRTIEKAIDTGSEALKDALTGGDAYKKNRNSNNK